MNDRRNHQMACGADESMYVHGERRRSLQAKPCHEGAALTLLPPRPRTFGEARLFSRDAQPSGLQVQGFCCPLRQRPSSGRVTHRATAAQSRGEGEETLLSSLKGGLETRGKAASRSRGKPEMTSHSEVPTVRKDPETPTTSCDNERQARPGQPGATQVSELHLYLPSSVCEEDEQDAEAEEMR